MPTDLEAQIPPKHLMRVVSTAIDKMNLTPLEAQYEGTSSYHPKMLLKVLVYAYTRYEITPQDVIAEDDKVVVRATLRATHEGELIGIPRTGVQVAIPLLIVYQIAKGKIINQWLIADILGLMQQIEAIPQTEQETSC